MEVNLKTLMTDQNYAKNVLVITKQEDSVKVSEFNFEKSPHKKNKQKT